MTIAKVEVFPLILPMKQNFSIAGGSVGSTAEGAPHVYVKITDEEGCFGWGEARPSRRWSYETPESVTSSLERYLGPALIGLPIDDWDALHRAMNREIAGSLHVGQPIAKAAIDMAMHDLVARRRRMRLPELWQSPFRGTIPLSYLISVSTPEEAEAKARAAVSEGYAGVDVKIGFDPRRDIAVVEAVKSVPGIGFFRVDANQGYDLAQAVKVARELARIGVDVLEQPLPAGDWHGHRELRRKADVPIALDEGVWTPRDVIQAVRTEACDAVVIKVTKMGGLRGAKRCGDIAAAAGLAMLGGGLTESGLGLTASAHLFHSLQIDTPVDLNGPLFLSDDPLETGPELRGGIVTLPDAPGIGCVVSESKLHAFLRRQEG